MAKKKKSIVEIAREKMAKAKKNKDKHAVNAQSDIETLNALKSVVSFDMENICTKFTYEGKIYQGIKLQEILNKSIWLLSTMAIAELTEDSREVDEYVDGHLIKTTEKYISNMVPTLDIYVVSFYDIEICGKSICDAIDAYGAFHKHHADRLAKKHKSVEYKIGMEALRKRLEANSIIDG